MKLTFDVKNQILSRTDRQNVIANSTDYLEAEVTFSEDWNGLEKNMSFVSGDTNYTYVLEEAENDKWVIAQNQHLNLGIGTWKASIIGVSGDKRIVTNAANVAIRASGWIGVDGPLPSVYEQLLVIIQSLHTEAASTAVIRSAVQQYIVDNYDALVKEVVVIDDVRAALDDMAEDGSLSALLDPLVAEKLPEEVADQIGGVVANQIGGTVASQLPAEVTRQIGTPTTQAVKNYCDENFQEWAGGLDSTLTQPLMAAPADKVGELKSALIELESDVSTLYTHKVAQPLDEYNRPTNGTQGQSLRTNGDGTTEWADVGLPTDAQTAQAVNDWLNNHPEATTTVEDGSLTYRKLVNGTLGFVTPEMYGLDGSSVLADTLAFKSAIESGYPVILDGRKTYVLDNMSFTGISKVYIDGHGATIHVVPHSTQTIFLEFTQCQNVTIKNLFVYSENIYNTSVEGSDHEVPTGSKSSNTSFVGCISCGNIKLHDIVTTNMYRLFTTWRVQDDSNIDILNNYVEIINVKTNGWVRSDIYLAYVKYVIVSNYETTPDPLCIKGVHVFYIASSYKSKLITDNVYVHGLKESADTGWITGVYQLAGNAVNSTTNDTTVRMSVYAHNTQIENCKVSVLVQNFDGEVVLNSCTLKNNTIDVSNLSLFNPTVRFNECTIISTDTSNVIVETVSANYESTNIEFMNCVIDVSDTFICGGNNMPNMVFDNCIMNIGYAITHNPINGYFNLLNNKIRKNTRGDFIKGTGTGSTIVNNNYIETKGGDPQFKTESGILFVTNNVIRWLDSAATLASSNAITQNNVTSLV